MTSEVALLNSSAVAVAADSAVTVGRNKVHRTANKIFLISDKQPIGLMFHGFADFADIPWETIIKQFRKERGNTNFNTVEECCEDFFEFLNNRKFLTENSSELSVAFFAGSIADRIVEEIQEMRPLERSKNIANIISKLTTEYEERETLDNFNMPTQRIFSNRYRDLIYSVINNTTMEETGYKVPLRVEASLSRLIYTAIASKFTSEYGSGIVFFGFGSEEIMPTLIGYIIDGVPFQQIRKMRGLSSDITRLEHDVAIYAFADQEVANLFMEGINNDMKRTFFALMRVTAQEIARRVVRDNFTVSDEEYKVIETFNDKTIDDILSSFATNVEKYIYDNSSKDVMDAVRKLPKEDMATLAEAIVEVSGLRKKVSPGVESVAGPVDVAVVTKGDGFVWVKRKHYFDLTKNLHYIMHRFGDAGLLRGGGTDANA